MSKRPYMFQKDQGREVLLSRPYSLTIKKRDLLKYANGYRINDMGYQQDLGRLIDRFGDNSHLVVYPLLGGFYTVSWTEAERYWLEVRSGN